jgi:hypothetical protein
MSESTTPPIHENCRCNLLEFPKNERKIRQETEKAMQKIAAQEFYRRELLDKAIELIGTSPAESFELIKESVYTELYLGDIERIVEEKSAELIANPEFTRNLMLLLLKIHKFKYDKAKYEHFPPAMKLARVEYGDSLIKERFLSLIPEMEEILN